MNRSAITLMSLLITATAQADVLATCGASEGHGYYPHSRVVSKEDSGWQRDGISKGSYQLIRSGEDYDIIFTDATGGTVSSRADGGHVTAVKDGTGNLLVLVIYPGKTVESYIFWFGTHERTMTYSQARYGATIPKQSLMRASCEW
jgi:hypothetical protein